MSTASLERTADWWESFITHAVCPDPHPLRQCNLTLAHTQTNLCMRYASFPPMTSLMMSPVWVGDGYLIQTHQRATTPPQTHTHTTALHESPCPHPITPPCPSCRGTSLALCISSTSTEQSAAQWHHEAQSRSLGLSLFVVLQLDYPITNGKYLGKWGLNIFAI